MGSVALQKMGPCGGDSGVVGNMDPTDVAHISRIVIHHEECIHAFIVHYECLGREESTGKWGKPAGNHTEFTLPPNEHITAVRGHYGYWAETVVVRSLKLETNFHKYGPFGVEEGTSFELLARSGQIIGFHARHSRYLNAIGVYVKAMGTTVGEAKGGNAEGSGMTVRDAKGRNAKGSDVTGKDAKRGNAEGSGVTGGDAKGSDAIAGDSKGRNIAKGGDTIRGDAKGKNIAEGGNAAEGSAKAGIATKASFAPRLKGLQQKELTLHLYMRQNFADPNKTHVYIGGPNQQDPKRFGSTTAHDWPLLDGLGEDAKVVAHARGIDARCCLDDFQYYRSQNIVFVDKRKGSSLQVHGLWKYITSKPPILELAIVGGTGQFTLAQGIMYGKQLSNKDEVHITELIIHAFYWPLERPNLKWSSP